MNSNDTIFDPKNCGLYKPGHRTHPVQAKVKYDLPRFPAEVELISPYSLRVITSELNQVFYYHDAIDLQMKCLVAVDGDIKFAPDSNLLYVKTKGPEVGTRGAWFPAYLSEVEPSPCAANDPDSGFFQLRAPGSDLS